MLRLFVFFLSFSSILFASDKEKICTIKDTVILAVLEAESHPKRDIGYQYLVSFNNNNEAKLVKNYLPELFIDSRVIDCKDMQTCVLLTKKLLEIGINNLDLGAFQINSYWHKKEKIEEYFSYSKSYDTACNYLEKMVDKHGYNWFAIASYNSQTPGSNVKYQRKLIDNYFKK